MVFPCFFFKTCGSNHVFGQIHMLFFLDRLYSNCLHPRNWRVWSSKWPTFVFTNLLPTYHCGEWRHIFVQPPAPLELNFFSTQIQGVRGLQNDFHKKLDGMQRLHKRCLGSVHGACGETGEQWRLDAVFFYIRRFNQLPFFGCDKIDKSTQES